MGTRLFSSENIIGSCEEADGPLLNSLDFGLVFARTEEVFSGEVLVETLFFDAGLCFKPVRIFPAVDVDFKLRDEDEDLRLAAVVALLREDPVVVFERFFTRTAPVPVRPEISLTLCKIRGNNKKHVSIDRWFWAVKD